MRFRTASDLLVTVSFIAFLAAATPQSDPCLDGENVIVDDLKLPSKYANLTPPWRRADGKTARVIRSEGLNYQWSWMKALFVKGLHKSVDEVIQFLNENDCLFVPVGSFVRSVLLRQKVVYASGEVSCELHELYTKCVEKFGASGCALYPIEDGGWGAYRLEIGDASVNQSTYAVRAEPIVLYEWRSKIGALREKWRFTVDTLAMFDDGAGDLLVIDPTGDGYRHVCDKKLVPAIANWKRWSLNQPLKVMGFYDLRTDGFAAHNETFQKFVNTQIKSVDQQTAQKFYCEHVLKGVSELEASTPLCHTTYPVKEATAKIKQMRQVMITEMGVSWNSSLGKAVDGLEASYHTPLHFAEKRARIMHKVSSGNDENSHEHPPVVIEEGRPMIDDRAQVHARPILDMAEKAPELPPEYPNVARVHPNQDLEFVEHPPLVEGAGSEPIAYHDGPESSDHEEEPEDEVGTPSRIEGGTVETHTDYTHHNSIPGDVPFMKFDKVEEVGLGDASAAAMEISTSSATSSSSIPAILLVFIIAFI